MSQNYRDKKLLGGFWTAISPAQHSLLNFTLILGGMLAFYNRIWFTFFGAIVGLLATILLEYLSSREWFARMMSRPANSGRSVLSRVFMRLAKIWCFVCLGNEEEGEKRRFPKLVKKVEVPTDAEEEVTEIEIPEPVLDRASEGFQLIERVIAFTNHGRDLIKRELPGTYQRLVLTGAAKAPARYVQWFIMGLLMIVIFSGGHFTRSTSNTHGSPTDLNHSVTSYYGSHHTIPWQLDLVFGLLIAVSVIRETLNDISRDASYQVSEYLPDAMRREMNEVSRLAGKSIPESFPELARLRSVVRRKGYGIGQLDKHVRNIKEELYNLALLCLALAFAYWKGAGLAFLAAGWTLKVMSQRLLAIHRSEKGLPLKRAVSSGLSAYLEDSRGLSTIRTIARVGSMIFGINHLAGEISEVKEQSRKAYIIQRYLARLVFFSLFALSAIFPLYATLEHELNTRRALLYWILLTGFWYCISRLADSASRIVGIHWDDVTELEAALEAIREQQTESDDEPKPMKAQVPAIELREIRFGYHGEMTLLRTPKVPISIPTSPADAEIVNILGRPRSGKSTLLKLLAGELAPSSGAITFGDYASLERDRLAYFPLIPDEVPVFPKVKIIELFQEYLNLGPTPKDPFEAAKYQKKLEIQVRKYLSDFGLLKEIEFCNQEEFTGINLVIGHNGRFLNEEQNRLLFLALQYASMEMRLKENDYTLDPDFLLLDGVHRFASRERRKLVVERFKKLCDEFHTTLVVARENPVDLDLSANEVTLCIIEPQDFSPDEALEGERGKPRTDWSHLVSGGRHRDRFNHSDAHRRSQYRAYLKRLAEAL